MIKNSFLDEFKAFIARGNVIDMAVGIIVGAAFTAIVTSLVSDVINPILGIIIGDVDFSNMFIALDGSDFTALEDAQEAGAPILAYGLFIYAVIKFLIVALVIFTLVRQINKLKQKQAEQDAAAPPAPSRTEVLLEEIRDALKK